jgi:hypothetical protein
VPNIAPAVNATFAGSCPLTVIEKGQVILTNRRFH